MGLSESEHRSLISKSGRQWRNAAIVPSKGNAPGDVLPVSEQKSLEPLTLSSSQVTGQSSTLFELTWNPFPLPIQVHRCIPMGKDPLYSYCKSLWLPLFLEFWGQKFTIVTMTNIK